MKYVALLRGINVGGNNIIKMADLKVACETAGFSNVITFIQSGNVIFESSETNSEKITKKLETTFSKAFNYQSKIVLRSLPQLKKVLKEMPADWKTRQDIRCYVAFIKEPITADDVLKEVELRDDVDYVKKSEGVLYFTTVLSEITKSKLGKIIVKKIFQNVTIRNLNSTKKILALMEVS
jgi:uncharacterized protein (DUF1697 family)